jgi:integrase
MWERAEAGSVTERHIKDRLDTLRRHCEAVLNLPLNKLDTARLDALRAEYLAGERRTPNWKPGTVLARSPGGWNKVRRHLMAIANWCIARELLDSMPFRSKAIKAQEKIFAVIWPEEAGRFLEVVQGITRSQDKRTAIRLMVQLGLREDQALNALWEGFDERMGVYRVFKSKNREAREIALPPGLIGYLREAHGDGKRGLIMTDIEDGAHRRSYTRRTVGLAGKRMDVDGLHPHALRATFATAHWEAGTPLSQITSMLGHKDPKTTMIYIRQRPRDAAAAQKKVAETMGL